MAKQVRMDQVPAGTLSVNQNQQSVARGQQFLQSLLSTSTSADEANTNHLSNPQASTNGHITDSLPLGRQGNNVQGQVDGADMMSQIFQSPGFSNLLTGFAEQTGIGSSENLRNMLEQCTQNPAVRNTLNGIAQQIEGQPQSGRSIFQGIESGQGGFDLSRMIQQMMPAVSQAFGGRLTRSMLVDGLQPNFQTQGDDSRSRRGDILHQRNSAVRFISTLKLIYL